MAASVANVSQLVWNRNIKSIESITSAVSQSYHGTTLPFPVCSVIAEYSVLIMDSEILDLEEQGDLLTMIEDQLGQKQMELVVVYRGSRDGFNVQPFLNKSKGIPNTIMVIHSDHGTKFGGYTQVPWSDDGEYHEDKTAFLYQLRPECKVFPLLEGKEQWAVCHDASQPTFPFFGNWGELVLYPNCNLNQNSNCYIRKRYETFDFKGNEICGGNAHPISKDHHGFKVLELELVVLLSQHTIDYIVQSAKKEHSNIEKQSEVIQRTLELIYDDDDAERITKGMIIQ